MLPIEIQREVVTTFRTRMLSNVTKTDQAICRAKGEMVASMREAGRTFTHADRTSMHSLQLHKRIWESLLAFDAKAAEGSIHDYAVASQARLDRLACKATSVIIYDYDDRGGVGGSVGAELGATIARNLANMRDCLQRAKRLRVSCAMAI